MQVSKSSMATSVAIIIYRVTNKLNGKIYIGQTSRKLNHRWREHVRQSKKAKRFHLHEAINKYGEQNFVIEKIDEAHSQIEANRKETYWITNYDSVNTGYNICYGPEDHRTMGNKSWQTKSDAEKEKHVQALLTNNANWWANLSEKEKQQLVHLRKANAQAARNQDINYGSKVASRVSAWWSAMDTKAKDKISTKISIKHSKDYVVTDPYGTEYEVTGLKQFCDAHKLHQGAMNGLARGKGSTYKGWKCRYA